MKARFSRALAAVLCLLMLVTLVPMTAFAAEYEQTLTTASKKGSQLAPGVKETEVVAYDKNGNRIVYYVVNADIATNSDVLVKANYHDNDNTGNWGKATVVEQANAAKAKRGYNVVASTNASYYNVSTGQPTGAFVMEGVNINGNNAGDAYNFFAIMKDGTAMIGSKGTWSQYADSVQEAIGGWTMLIKDGKICDGLSESKYPRSTVGIKADGNVVLMVADGNQSPYSVGMTYKEQAEVMYSLGCVDAVELDGGGSATYAAKLEGTDEIVVRNSCCDGTVRSVSNTLMVISTAVADGTFDHANLATDYAFHAAGSHVEIHATGADKGGHAAEIPATVTWGLSDDSFGTVADGIFVSNGKVGTVTINMLYNGKAVGSIEIQVVNPTSVSFAAEEKTVPYGKTSDFTVTAMYNGAEVYIEPSAFDFTCTVGLMNGFIYQAPNEDAGISTATVTAQYKYSGLAATTVTVTFGKGSEVLFDFEDGSTEWGAYRQLQEAAASGAYTGGYLTQYVQDGAYQSSNQVVAGIQENTFLASKSEGYPVHSGEYSLAYTFDYRQAEEHANWMYGYLYYWGKPVVLRDVENGIAGTRIGMWMYIPEEAVGSCARLAYTFMASNGKMNTAYLYMTYQYVKKGFSKLTSDKIPESGWAYVYCDLDDISTSYVSTSVFGNRQSNPAQADYAPAFIQWIISSSATGAEKVTFYIDDITLDYSDVVDDRDAPVISNPLVLDDQHSYTIKNNTIDFNTISVTADAAEDTSHGTNYTGLDTATAQVYVDGQPVDTNFAAGKISASGIVLPNGTHDISFEIADKQGNYTKLTRQVIIAAGTDYPVVSLEGQALADGLLKTGAQYNLLLKTDKVEAIDSITVKIWLNSASKWALEHMTVLSGFEVNYTIDELSCTAEITVTRKDAEASGAAVLATLPVYAWSWDGSAGRDAHAQWTSKGCAPQITVSYKVKSSSVVYTDAYAVAETGYIPGFSNVRTDVQTELNSSIANLKNTIGEWHYHTAEAVADKAATCTEDGYTGRTACSACNSIIDWGTTVPATGHGYDFFDGVLQCTACGKLYNGIYTDGKEYKDGVLVKIEDGWQGNSYYRGGVKLTGIQLIDGFYYDFGTDGVCEDRIRYTGLLEENGNVYYAVVGSLMSGWQQIGTDMYYFNPATYAGINGKYTSYDLVKTSHYFEYSFVDGKLSSGAWSSDASGTRYYYGPAYLRGWQTIDGATYYFDVSGYRYEGAHRMETGTYSGIFKWFNFTDEGVYLGVCQGVLRFGENVYYMEDGQSVYAGLVKDTDGSYYYISGNGCVAIKNRSYYITKTNGLLPAGTYTFGDDCKMIIKQGVVKDSDGQIRYYVDGQAVYAGLVKDADDSYYYISGNGCVAIKNRSYYITKTNGLLPAGTYTFGDDCKMIIKQGVVKDSDGQIRYYVDGQAVYAGLVKDADGSYYYISGNGCVAIKNRSYYITKTNGLLPAGTYTFGDDCKMIIKQGVVKDSDGQIRYYVDGQVVYAGLVKDADGSYYYISGNGCVAIKNRSYYITKTNGLLPEGLYTFGDDCKMIVE